MMIPLIPSLPQDNLVIEVNGQYVINPQWAIFFSQLTTSLQNIISLNGLKFPMLTQDQINSLNTPTYIGGGVYNTTTQKFMLNETGVFKTVVTS